MRLINPDPSIVSGTALERVARVFLPAGDWDIDMVLGVPGAVSTATLIVRPIGGATALTFTTALSPNRRPSQRLTLVAPTEIEFMVQNSAPNVGAAVVEDIRIALAPLQLWANGIRVAITSGVSPVSTSVSVASATGLPAPTGGQYFLATLVQGATFEIVRCTARVGTSLTITRAQEGTAAGTFEVGQAFLILADSGATLSRLQAVS